MTYSFCCRGIKLLSDFPPNFAPAMKKGCIDGVFLLFKDHFESIFLSVCIFIKHPNLIIKIQPESGNKIFFLDCCISGANTKFFISVYRKYFSCGLGIRFCSFSAF